MTTPPSVANLRRAAKDVYLATEAEVADDISQLFIWAANRIEELESQLPKPEPLEPVVHNLEAAPLHSGPPKGGPA